MANIFFAADYHFGHENCFKTFKLADGVTPLRPFSSVEEMNETMIERHNKVVRPEDKIYMLGDLAMGPKWLYLLGRMNGEKVLIKGNHDNAKLSQYLPYFKDVRGSHQFDGMLLTHIPVHPLSLARWGLNVHGHLHSYNVPDQYGKPDKRYRCVSVEQINYTPISLEEIRKDAGL